MTLYEHVNNYIDIIVDSSVNCLEGAILSSPCVYCFTVNYVLNIILSQPTLPSINALSNALSYIHYLCYSHDSTVKQCVWTSATVGMTIICERRLIKQTGE